MRKLTRLQVGTLDIVCWIAALILESAAMAHSVAIGLLHVYLDNDGFGAVDWRGGGAH